MTTISGFTFEDLNVRFSPRQRLVIGNWKMNVADGGCSAFAREIAKSGPYGCAVVMCVPHPFIGEVERAVRGTDIRVGAQDCSDQPAGAFTGEVSARMLAELRCRYVIVGHSERRARHHETDLMVSAKAKMALASELTPVICVGETLDERARGEAVATVTRQVGAVIKRLGTDIERCVIAYEPVWAVGSGRTASAEQAQGMHSVIRRQLQSVSPEATRIPILYSGSVKPESADELFSQADIDGALVGGASLDLEQFVEICSAGASATALSSRAGTQAMRLDCVSREAGRPGRHRLP